jgi:hypothetical protein
MSETWEGDIARNMEDEGNPRGPKRDDSEQFHRLVRHLVADGDDRAARAGRRARRTLREMRVGGSLSRQTVRLPAPEVLGADG